MHNIIERLTLLDYATVAAYIIILAIIGYKASLSNRNQADQTLFLAHKSLGWASIGFNMWGTNVGPSMLLAFASIGYSTGVVAVNFDWYAFVFLMLLAMVFAPRYLVAQVTTMPEFMGNRYGDSTHNVLAWYALIKILISWLSLGLFAGGFLVRQILGIPMWESVIALVSFGGILAYSGGLNTIAKVNVFQMILLIAVSLTLTILGINKVGGLSAVYHKVPHEYWNLIHPASDKKYPWYAILLGYPVAAVAFFCTDQSMVQSVLGAKNLEQGQLGINFIGWLKILSLPLFILTGILCYILFPHLKDPAEAYMTMVTNLFPSGMNGLVIVVLVAVLVGTIGSSLNSLSTVFTMDVYAKKINPNATNQDVIRVGRITVIVGCLLAVIMALAIDSIKGLNLFDVFQSVLGFIAPPLSVVFLLTVFWKRTTRKAVNLVLSVGSALSLGTGIVYLWVLPSDRYSFWPHYLILSFLIFIFLLIAAVMISLLDSSPEVYRPQDNQVISLPKTTLRVKVAWVVLTIVMIGLYLIFNGH
ncbi:sodium/solute symporter [Mucilaginibacter robiniae]|uniref:Sodium/solute symporter n=1 Tax=Mucilaginibacter robiniae TaxID=2728022 RepID=A0A7L5E4S1_9SPHI|nr:sodium/solute symporter [Mucilaginibacter robiniae]QJD97299.1 sodium/solute symporter [Mucilaginibacter robiniae]